MQATSLPLQQSGLVYPVPVGVTFAMQFDGLKKRRTSRGTRWRRWLRHCDTNRKVAGSIHDGVIGIFQLLNPSGRIVALGSTQRVTEMSTRNPSWG